MNQNKSYFLLNILISISIIISYFIDINFIKIFILNFIYPIILFDFFKRLDVLQFNKNFNKLFRIGIYYYVTNVTIMYILCIINYIKPLNNYFFLKNLIKWYIITEQFKLTLLPVFVLFIVLSSIQIFKSKKWLKLFYFTICLLNIFSILLIFVEFLNYKEFNYLILNINSFVSLSQDLIIIFQLIFLWINPLLMQKNEIKKYQIQKIFEKIILFMFIIAIFLNYSQSNSEKVLEATIYEKYSLKMFSNKILIIANKKNNYQKITKLLKTTNMNFKKAYNAS